MNKLLKIAEEIKKDYSEDNLSFSTGIEPLDILLDGGLECGITQLVGEHSTGKTTLALQIAYSYCTQGKNVLFINTKGDITTVDLQNMNLLEFKDKQFFCYFEADFNKVENLLDKFISTDEISLIIIDSIASLMNSGYLITNSKAIKSDNGNSGYNSKPLSILVKKLAVLSIKKKIAVLMTNQYKNTIQMYGKNKGTRTKIGGPKSLINESKYVIEIRSISESNNISRKFRDCFLGIEKVNIGKSFEFLLSKGRHPNMILPYFFEYGVGYSSIYSIVMFMINNNIIEQNGTYYSLDNVGINEKGINNFMLKFKKHPPKNYGEYVMKYYEEMLKVTFDNDCD